MKAGSSRFQTRHNAASECRADKPAPKLGAPRECQANYYMPLLSAAIWLDSDLEQPLGRLKMDSFFISFFWSSEVFKDRRGSLIGGN